MLSHTNKVSAMNRLPAFLQLSSVSEELVRLDLLRFISSVAIVFYHVSTMFALQPEYLQPAIKGFHVFVDLFFAISGIVIAMVYSHYVWTWPNYVRFLRRRLARIGPLHWATLLFYIMFGLVIAEAGLTANDPSRYDLRCALPQALLIHAFDICANSTFNRVSWSISAEMAMYALFPLFLLLARYLRGLLIPIAVFIALGLTALDPTWLRQTFAGGWIRAVPSFLFGITLFRFRCLLPHWMGVPMLGWIAGIALFCAALVRASDLMMLALAWAWVAFAYAADLSRRAGALVRALSPLGQLTYSIYMLHPVMMTIGITVIGTGLLSLDGLLLNIWIVFLFLFPFPMMSAASYHYFENPLRRWLGGSSPGRPTPSSVMIPTQPQGPARKRAVNGAD